MSIDSIDDSIGSAAIFTIFVENCFTYLKKRFLVIKVVLQYAFNRIMDGLCWAVIDSANSHRLRFKNERPHASPGYLHLSPLSE